MSKRQGLLAKAGVDLEGPTQVVVDREANEQQELVAPCAEPSPPAVELGRVQDLVGNHVVGLALTGDLVDGFEGVVRGEVAQALVAQGPVESVFSSNTAMLRAMGAAHEGDPDTAFRSARDSSGRPLPPAVQRRMERLLGHDFEHVRIHTDTPAHVASKAIYARAWTRGHDIYFGRGEWHPGSNGGTALLAHELTHVVQHDEGRLPTRSAGGPRVSSPSDPVEREAHQVEQDALVAMVDGLLDAPTVDGPLDARTSDGVLQAPRAEGVLPGPPIHSADMPVHRKEDKKKDATTKKKKDDKDDPAARLDKVCKLLDEVRPSCLAAAKAIDQVDWSGWRSAAAAVASALVRVEQDRKDLSSILGFDTSELEKKLRDPVLVAAFHPVTFKGRPVVPAKVLPVIGENVGKWAKARQAAMEKLFAAAGKLRHQPPPGYRQNHPDTWRDWKAQPHHYAPPGSYNSEQLRELAGRLRAELAPFGGRDWLYLAQALSDKETLIDPRIKKLVLADAGSQLLVAQFSEGLQGSLDPDSAAGRIWAQVDLVGRAALTLRGAIDRLDAAAWLNGATALVEQVTGVERSIKELRTTPGVSEREVGMVERKLQMDGRILSAFYPSFVPDGSGGLRPTVGFLPRAGTGAMSTRLFSRLGSVYLMIASLPELEKEISTILPRYGTRINRDGDRVNTFVSPEVDVRKVIDKRLMGMSGRDRMWVLSHLLSSQSLSADQKAALIKSSDDAHRRLVKEELTPKPGSDKPKDPTSPAGRLWSNVEALAASSGKARDAFESVDVKEWVAGSAATIRKAEGLDKGLDGLAKSDPKAAAPVTRKLARTHNILMAFHPQAFKGKALGPWLIPPSRIPLAPEMRVQQSAMTKLARAAVQVQAKGQSTGKLGLTAFIPSEGSAYGTIREIEGLLSPWRGRNWLFLFEALRATQVDPTLLSIVGRSRSMQIRIDVAERKGVSADELKRVKETFEQLRTLLAQVEVPRQGEKPSSNLLSCRPTLVTLVSLYHGEARGVLFRMLRDANLYQKLFHVIGFQKFNGLRNNAGKDWSGPLGDQRKYIRDNP